MFSYQLPKIGFIFPTFRKCNLYSIMLWKIYGKHIDLRENIPLKYDNPTTTHRFVKVLNDPQLVKS